MIRRLAIIPARGGSKRIPNKNVRDFCGKPMIAYILDVARRSGLFECIHVSTDDARIAQVAADLGFAPDFMRPAELADDHAPLMPVLKHATSEFVRRGQKIDQVWLLMACAPLIESDDLRNAEELFMRAGGERAVLAVAPFPAPVEWAFDRHMDGSLVAVQPGMFAVRSQDLAPKYYDTGSFCVFSAHRVMQSSGAGDDSGFVGHVLPRHKAIDIDTEEDWLLAETMFRSLKVGGAGDAR